MKSNERVSDKRSQAGRRASRWVLGFAVVALMFGSARLHAQSDETGVGEVGVYAGTMVGPLGGHATVGGHFGGAFSRYAIGMIDTAYT